MSSLPKLVDCDGTPRVTLDKGELAMDGVLDEGEIPAEQRMHVRPSGRDSVKPAARRFLTGLRGDRRRCIHDPRSMHFAAEDGCERYIKSDGLSRRAASPTVVDGENIKAESSQSVEIDGIETPVHREGYE